MNPNPSIQSGRAADFERWASTANQMRRLLLVGGLLVSSGLARAEMVRSDSIGNDPAKEQLCASRAKATLGNGKAVPFEIDSRYVALARSHNPDVTFIAIDGMSPQLVECSLNPGTGKFGPASFSPEGGTGKWHLIKPKQFEPGLNTQKGRAMARDVCLEAALAKINRPNFDHSSGNLAGINEINIGSPLYHPGVLIGGEKAERYDVAVQWKALYKSSGPDLAVVNVTCLLSPMLEVKAIQLK